MTNWQLDIQHLPGVLTEQVILPAEEEIVELQQN